jgi:hypothetical protein
MMDPERKDWVAGLAKPLRDHYDAVGNEPMPERLRELVEQLEQGKQATPPDTPLDPLRTAPLKDHQS